MRRVVLFSMLSIACFCASCHHHKKEPKTMPAMTIEVATAKAEEVVMRYEFVTHLKSNYDAIIQPRVNGYLLKKSFSAGMPVRKGDLLFVLDADLLNTTLYAAKAQLAAAEAQEVEARNNYERALPLAKINAISRAQLDHKRHSNGQRDGKYWSFNEELTHNYSTFCGTTFAPFRSF